MTENQGFRALLRELASSVCGKKLTNYWTTNSISFNSNYWTFGQKYIR